jgi:hypothetical protein
MRHYGNMIFLDRMQQNESYLGFFFRLKNAIDAHGLVKVVSIRTSRLI